MIFQKALLDGILVSQKGGGKSTFLESVRDVSFDLKIKVVGITDEKNNLEMATCLFLPKENYLNAIPGKSFKEKLNS